MFATVMLVLTNAPTIRSDQYEDVRSAMTYATETWKWLSSF